MSKNANTLLYTYKEGQNIVYIMSKDIIKMLRIGAISIELYMHRFPLSRISSHSLCSRGFMAL